MQLALPRLDQRDAYQKLATLYTVAFAVSAVSFYISLLQSGYDPSLALFAATSAALHYALLRLSGAFPAVQPVLEMPRFKPAAVLADADLKSRIEQLRQEARGSRDEVGLMLITLSAGVNDFAPPSADVMKVVRGELFRAADSRIFQIDERTLAIAECQQDVVLRFDKISSDLHWLLGVSQKSTHAEERTRATVGVAVAGGNTCQPDELMDNARTAIRLADANKRDTFFRRV
jgi:hypothetical protein